MHGISEDTNASLGCIFLDECGKDIVNGDPDLSSKEKLRNSCHRIA